MKPNKILAYLVLVACGLILVAGVVLVALQWAQRASFSLYGYPYNIEVISGKAVGGVNTAMLMLLSAVGGILAAVFVRLICWALGALRKACRAAAAEGQPPAGATA